MSALAALALHLVTALALALLTRWLLSWEREDGPRLSRLAAGLLTLLPLAFTWGGFLPGKVLAPTNTLTRVAPWKDPELVTRVEQGSTPPNLLLVDPVSQFLPWRRAARGDLSFNPAQGGGAALLGNGQSAVLFPTEIAARWLTPLRAAGYSQTARLLIAAFGLFLLVRSLGGSEPAALAGAAVFVGSGYLQLWRLHPHSLTAAVIPWVIWAALQVARSSGDRRPGSRAAVALAVTGALGLVAGHAETLLHGVLLAAVVATAVLLRRWRSGQDAGRALLRPVAWAAVSGLLAALLAAPALLPFVENLVVSAEWQRRDVIGGFPSEAPWGVATAQLAFAVTPWAYGDPRVLGEDGEPLGPNNAAELGGGAVGAVAWLLVIAALLRPPLPRPVRRAASSEPGARPLSPHPALWLGLGLVGVLVGAQVPGISRLLAALPLMGLTILGRLSLWAALAAAVLAAAGWDRLTELRGELRLGPPFLLAVALVASPLVLVAVLLPSSRAFAGIPLEALALAAAAVSVGRLVHGRWVRPALVLLALALVLPRAITFHGWIPVASSLSFYPDTLAVRHVQEQIQEAPPAAGWRVAGLDAAYLPHSAAFHGLEEARAYDPMTFGPYQSFLALWGETPPRGGIRLLDPAAPGLAFLGVRWIFDHPSMTHRPGVEVVYAGRDALVYENPRALPRVFVPRELEVVDDEEDALRVAGEIADFSQRVALHGRDLPPQGRYPNGTARVVERSVEPGRLTAVVEAEAKAVVATSQPAIPGWRLTRDGEEYEPLRVNGAFLAAAVEPGTSRLEWRYAPRSWRWGWLSFALGVMLAVCVAWIPFLRIRGRAV